MACKGETYRAKRVVAVAETSAHVRTRAVYGVATLSCGHRFSAVLSCGGRPTAVRVGARRRCHECRTGEALL
jgi:hypothetical protein